MLESDYYSRQTSLSEVGEVGQEKLRLTKALIIGAGGLGHPVANYLAAAGLGNITILDFDHIEGSNLNRQTCFTLDEIGLQKAEVLAQKISKQNPFIKVEVVNSKLTPDNAEKIVREFDLLIDCSDNFATKFLLHDCAWLLGKKLVQASIYQYEGQIQIFDFSNSVNKTKGCLRCLWPKTPKKNCVQNCSEAGVIGAVAGTLGTLQAMEAIKITLGLGETLLNTTVTFNLLDLSVQRLKWHKDESCPLCSENASIQVLDQNNYEHKESYELIGLEQDGFTLIDIRELEEGNHELLEKHDFLKRPLSKLNQWSHELDQQEKYLFICLKGIRSSKLVEKLKQENLTNCYSLYKGLEAYALR